MSTYYMMLQLSGSLELLTRSILLSENHYILSMGVRHLTREGILIEASIGCVIILYISKIIIFNMNQL